jgi:uncharacterized protein
MLPEGFKYDILRKWGDNVAGDDAPYGYNNDYVAYFPIDALDGGQSSTDGILWVNHEYPDSKWVSEYEDSERETEKSPEQIAQEKAVVGGSIFRLSRNLDESQVRRLWSVDSGGRSLGRSQHPLL